MYGDPEGVRRLARRMDLAAESTRDDAVAASSAAGVAWVSVRAGRYREQLTDSVALTRRAAQELDDLGRVLVEHADAVQRRLEQIAAAERWLRSRAQDAEDLARSAGRELADRLADLGGVVVDGVERAAGAVADFVGDVVGAGTGAARAAAEQAVDEARELARRADDEAAQWNGPLTRLRPGELDWVDTARSMGWSG